MATYYVRKSGSDANNGTSPGTAWATIGKALGTGSPVTGGDTVYIGGGVYAESVSVAISPTSEVKIVGDVTGFYTGDGGEVRITRYTSGDNSAPNTSSAPCIGGSSVSNLTFENIIFEGYNNVSNGICVNFNGNIANITFRRCRFMAASGSGVALVLLGSTSVAQTMNVLFDSCTFLQLAGSMAAIRYQQGSQATDFIGGVTCVNCIIMTAYPVIYNINTTNPGRPSGLTFKYCLLQTRSSTNSSNLSSKYPTRYQNCVFMADTDFSSAGGGLVVFGGNVTVGGQKVTYPSSSFGTSYDKSGADKRCALDSWYPLSQWQVQTRAIKLNREHWYSAGYDVQSGASGTQAEDTSVGTEAWSNLGNITQDDSNYATSSLIGQNDTSRLLKATNFGFSVPSNATIVSIGVRIVAKASALSTIKHNLIKLIVGGTVTGNNKAPTSFLSTSDTTTLVEDTPSGWGVTLSPSDVNNASFGVAYQAIFAASSGAADVNVNSIYLYVIYQCPPGDSSLPTTDFYGRPRPTTMLPTPGPFDVHDHGVIQSAVARSGSALQLTGPGDHEFLVPVQSGQLTVSVYARYDTNHGTAARPQLQVVSDQCGIALTTATMTAGVDTWEQLSVTVTAQKAGLLTVRLVSRAQNANGNAYFDDFNVS